MRGWLLAPALALAGACSGYNPLDLIRGGPSGPKPAPLPELAQPQAVRLLWSASVSGAERFIFSPAFAGDSVYAASRAGEVVRLDAASGQARWRVTLEARLSGGVGSDGRTVAVATDQGEVFALDAQSGAQRWRARASSEVLAAPAVGAGLVLVRSADSRVFAFGADDGKRRWVYQRAAMPLSVRSPSGIAISGETAFAGFPGGKLVALALANGGVRWEATVALPKGATELERVTDVVGDPALQAREVCAAAYQGRVACFETASGRQLWAREVSSLTGVSLDARYAYVSDDRGAVHALDRSSGRSVWKQDRLAHRRLSLPLAAGNAVAVGDFEGYVHFLARDSGAFVARFATGATAIVAAPTPLPGGLVVQTQSGGLYALSP
jgi:outer membrane protein assembly factor BamB